MGGHTRHPIGCCLPRVNHGGHHMVLQMQTSVMMALAVVKAPYGVAYANFTTFIRGAPHGVAYANPRESLSSRFEGTAWCCICKPLPCDHLHHHGSHGWPHAASDRMLSADSGVATRRLLKARSVPLHAAGVRCEPRCFLTSLEGLTPELCSGVFS